MASGNNVGFAEYALVLDLCIRCPAKAWMCLVNMQ